MPVRFAAVGLDHAHIFGMIAGLVDAGAELVGLASDDPEAAVCQRVRAEHPDVAWFDDPAALYADPTIDLIATAAVPIRRGEIAIAALEAGKDVLTDKPGVVTYDQLETIKKLVAEKGRFWDVVFSERFGVRAAIKAGELVHAGRIGRVVQTLGSARTASATLRTCRVAPVDPTGSTTSPPSAASSTTSRATRSTSSCG